MKRKKEKQEEEEEEEERETGEGRSLVEGKLFVILFRTKCLLHSQHSPVAYV